MSERGGAGWLSPKGAGAVMASRAPSSDRLDYFPTPPWATRALLTQVIQVSPLHSAWEPACGAGHMARPMEEFFARVEASDVADRGFGRVADFLWPDVRPTQPVDWIITNPPFAAAEQFVHRALDLAAVGVAMLCRTSFIEGVGRHESLFSRKPLAVFAPFSERVPMVKGRLDQKASTATSYAWFVWAKHWDGLLPVVKIIPPCRRELERPGDYQ
jgi:hypothetical protein